MVGAHHDSDVIAETVNGVEHLTEPVVDHREFRAVVAADVRSLPRGEDTSLEGTHRIGRPDQPLPFPVRVIHGCPRFRGVEGLVRIELVDEQQEAVVVRRGHIQPFGGRPHRPRAREVGFISEPGARVVVRAMNRSRPRGQGRGADSGGVGMGSPRVVLASTQVLPGGEVGVVVLAAGFEQMRVIGHEHRRDPGSAKRRGDRLLPHLNRAPRPPEEVERAHQQIVPSGNARQGTDVMSIEHDRLPSEPVEVRRLELVRSPCAEKVPVQAVEQHDDHTARSLRRGGIAMRVHVRNLVRLMSGTSRVDSG